MEYAQGSHIQVWHVGESTLASLASVRQRALSLRKREATTWVSRLHYGKRLAYLLAVGGEARRRYMGVLCRLASKTASVLL